MSILFVKPAPDLPAAAAKIIKSDPTPTAPGGIGLLDAAGNVPAAGMPWPNGGLTLRLLTDGVIKRADDPVFAKPVEPAAAPDEPSSSH